MSIESYDNAIRDAVRTQRKSLADHWDANVAFYAGPFFPALVPLFRDFIEDEKRLKPKDRLLLVLNSPGGQVESVEGVVSVIRNHYKEFVVVVPEMAMSAGTVLCMAADRIVMDYAACLGPIDPQVPNKEGQYVPALGYLDQVDRMIKASKDAPLSHAELVLLQSIDLASLNLYEQARDLTTALLQDWLVRYKFANWTEHRTDPAKKGQPVTAAEKRERAEQIAKELADHKRWHSHGRRLNTEAVKTLRLEVDCLPSEPSIRDAVRHYHDLLVAHANSLKLRYLLNGDTRE